MKPQTQHNLIKRHQWFKECENLPTQSIDPSLFILSTSKSWTVVSLSPSGSKRQHIRIRRMKNGKHKSYALHRLSYKHYKKHRIPRGYVVRHTCDNPRCINPEHLDIGTQQMNIMDAVRKNQQARGEKHGRHKLTVEQVKEIRNDHTTTTYALAKKFNTSHQNISQIQHGKTWKVEFSAN